MTIRDATLDEQHQKLFIQINVIQDALEDDQPAATVLEALAFLDGYIEKHFSLEEKDMRAHGFPLAEEHIAQHDDFRKKQAEYRQKIVQEPSAMLLQEVHGFLVDWWTEHVAVADIRYRTHLEAFPQCHPQTEPGDYHQTAKNMNIY